MSSTDPFFVSSKIYNTVYKSFLKRRQTRYQRFRIHDVPELDIPCLGVIVENEIELIRDHINQDISIKTSSIFDKYEKDIIQSKINQIKGGIDPKQILLSSYTSCHVDMFIAMVTKQDKEISLLKLICQILAKPILYMKLEGEGSEIKFALFYSADDKGVGDDLMFFSPVYLVCMAKSINDVKFDYQKRSSFVVLKTQKELKDLEKKYTSKDMEEGSLK